MHGRYELSCTSLTSTEPMASSISSIASNAHNSPGRQPRLPLPLIRSHELERERPWLTCIKWARLMSGITCVVVNCFAAATVLVDARAGARWCRSSSSTSPTGSGNWHKPSRECPDHQLPIIDFVLPKCMLVRSMAVSTIFRSADDWNCPFYLRDHNCQGGPGDSSLSDLA